MLDDLLGRTELREQIEALQEERDRLEARLEAESERRSEAVSARQDAEERVNRLEDRIADLEGRLEAKQETADLGFRREEAVRGRRLEAVCSRLESFAGDPESVLTAYVEAGVPDDVGDLLGDRAGLVDRAAPCLLWVDDAGLLAVAARPPVAPEPFVEWAEAPRLDRAWLQPTGRFALALVRSDTFAVGVYEGDERVDYEGFTSDVKSDHSKGGFSQARFERLRDEQIAAHVEKCEAALEDVEADRLYVVGDRRLVGEFAADGEGRSGASTSNGEGRSGASTSNGEGRSGASTSNGDATVTADATAAVDATGDPEEALADAFADFWTVRLYGL